MSEEIRAHELNFDGFDALPHTLAKVTAAVSLLTEAGFGIISPSGNCVANVGVLGDGCMALSTTAKPLYGMANRLVLVEAKP